MKIDEDLMEVTDSKFVTTIFEPISDYLFKEVRLFYPSRFASKNEIAKIETGRIFSKEERLEENVKKDYENSALIYSPANLEPIRIFLVETRRALIKLNVCCGDDYREGYVNIDFSDKRSDGKSIKVDLKRDVLRNGLPYDDSSIDEIVFRESLEHFNRHDGLKILRELFRVLKVGGRLDLTVPPALQQLKILLMQMSSAKKTSISDFLEAHEKFSVWKYHDDLMGGTREGSIGDSHLTLFTKEMLRPILEFVGFKIIQIDDQIQVYAEK